MFKTAKTIRPKETSVHQQIVNYLKLQYPKVPFRTDFAAGIKMTIGQAVKHKKLQYGASWPDLFIAQKSGCGQFGGIFLEIKRDKSEVWTKKGEIKSDPHILSQFSTLQHLRRNGYAAEFACGFDDAKLIIDDYLAGRTAAFNLRQDAWSGSVNL